MSDEYSVAVVVLTLSRDADLSECLKSLESQFVGPEHVIVVDGDSTASTRAIVDDSNLNTTYVHGKGDGIPADRNLATEHATEDIVCFVDDDVILPPNWLQEVLAAYEQEDADGVGGTVVNYTPESIEKANTDSPIYRLLTALRTICFHNRIGELGPMAILYAPHTFVGSRMKSTDVLQGCNMSFKSSVFEDQSFDEWYGYGGSAPGEEIEFCTRVKEDGHRLVHAPKATVIHKRAEVGGERTLNRQRESRGIRNMSYYLFEHSDRRWLDIPLMGANTLLTSAIAQSTSPIDAFIEGFQRYRKKHKE